MTRFLIFTIVKTRPDIAFLVAVATYFAKNPCHAQIEAIKNIFCYLKSSIDQDITYRGESKVFIDEYLDPDPVRDK